MGSAEFPWDDALLEDLAEALGPRPDRNRVQRLGEKLRTFLEQGLSKHQGWATHEQAILREVKAGRPVHLTFRFDAAELYSLPWELVALGSTGQHLGELPGCLIQYEWPGAGAIPALPSSTPGQLLFGWSAAGGGVPSEQHQSALTRAAARGMYSFDASQDVVSHLSLAALSRALREASRAGRPVSILHLLCHGTRTANGTTGLRWNTAEPDGPTEFIDAAALRQVLTPHKETLRLVVLCACHGGDAGAPGNVLGGVAQELHRVGISTVVASRMPLSVEGSVLLTEAFYGALEGLDTIRPALLAAKSALTGTGGYDWASLQLYARAEDAAPVSRPRPGTWKLATTLAVLAITLLSLGAGIIQQWRKTPTETGAVLEEQPLEGYILDEAEQPIADAMVSVSVGGDTVKDLTDERGRFQLKVRARRQLSVTFKVMKAGYEDGEDMANLGNTELSLTLKRKPLEKVLSDEEMAHGLKQKAEAQYQKGDFTRALESYTQALKYTSRTKRPQQWAALMASMGAAYGRLGTQTQGPDALAHLETAVVAYRSALEVQTREALPLDWGRTQHNLATTLRLQGERTEGEAGVHLLAQAVDTYRLALQVRTLETQPLEWASTQNDLGLCLWRQGERTKGEAGDRLISQAMDAYRLALRVRTREALPQEWSKTQHNLDLALKAQQRRYQEWLVQHPGDAPIQARLAENALLRGQPTEAQSLLASLLKNSQLAPGTTIGLHAVDITGALLQGKPASVPGGLAALRSTIAAQPPSFTSDWDFSGLRCFIDNDERLAPSRAWLHELLQALQAPQRDAMLTALDAARARFRPSRQP